MIPNLDLYSEEEQAQYVQGSESSVWLEGRGDVAKEVKDDAGDAGGHPSMWG